MTKLGVFDKFEEAKKYTGLSENDKMSNCQKWSILSLLKNGLQIMR